MVPRQLAGERYSRLVVRERSPTRSGFWICDCDCGGTAEARPTDLRSGWSTSCGCRADELGGRKRGSGQTGTRTYTSWCAMRQRCRDKNHESYKDYGGRGITVCQRWDSFETFLADMGERPPGMSLERIRTEDGYEPGNCRWANSQQQNGNRRNSRQLTYNGETLTLSAWARRIGVQRVTLTVRLRRGWTLAQALGFEPSPGEAAQAAHPRLVT